MGTATAPVRGSGGWPAWMARVAKPSLEGSPFTGENPHRVESCLRGQDQLPAGLYQREALTYGTHERSPPRDLLSVLPDPLGGQPSEAPGPDASSRRRGLARL